MNTSNEEILKEIQAEKARLEHFRASIASLIVDIKKDPNFLKQQCAIIIKELEKKLNECLGATKDGSKGGNSGSIYDRFFDKPKQEKEDEDEIRKKKLDVSKKRGALEILCQSSRISTTQGQTHGTNTRYTGNITANS